MTTLRSWMMCLATVPLAAGCFSGCGGAQREESVDVGGSPEAVVDEMVPDAAEESDLRACPSASGTGAAFRVRAVAGNLSSGNKQSYDLGHGLRILQGLKPDVVMLQEYKIGNNTASDVQGLADSMLNVSSGRAYVQRGRSGAIPNGVVSRWPIVSGGDWRDSSVSDRQFTWAKIDLPGPRDLWVVSVHLLTKGSSSRLAEARELVAHFNSNVPANDFLLLGGDFNTTSRTESAYSTLNARVVTQGPFPVDQSGDPDTNSSRAKPYDTVLASPCLDALETTVQLGSSSFPNGLVFDSRTYSPLSDAPGVLKGDSAAEAMQHMAVVRDFSVRP
jgi:endonuclease/exonuclease/phosphatase family metal-dependent hydrolase